MTYIPLAERRLIRAANSDESLPDYTKEPRPIYIVWEANNDFTELEIDRLWSLFIDKNLEGLTGEQGLMDTREVLTALLAYRNIPIRLLAKNIPKSLRDALRSTMSNLVGEVYWKLPNNCYQMKTDYLQTISSSSSKTQPNLSISITTKSKVY